MANYREKQARDQIRKLRLTVDETHFVVQRPQHNLGIMLGVLAALLFFFAGCRLIQTPRRTSGLPAPAASSLSPDGNIIHGSNPTRPAQNTFGDSYLAPPLVGLGTVFVGYLTAWAAARLFRVRIELDRQTNQVRVAGRILDSLTNVAHIGQARYSTLSSRAMVTRYEIALCFHNSPRKPLLICEFNSSDPSAIAEKLSSFLGVPVYAYQKSMS